MTNKEIEKDLPEFCYSINECSGEIILLKRNMCGYFPIVPQPTKSVDELNEVIEVSKAQEQAMRIGSLFGWECKGANPLNYNKEGEYIG